MFLPKKKLLYNQLITSDISDNKRLQTLTSVYKRLITDSIKRNPPTLHHQFETTSAEQKIKIILSQITQVI